MPVKVLDEVTPCFAPLIRRWLLDPKSVLSRPPRPTGVAGAATPKPSEHCWNLPPNWSGAF